jgi:hypothetical protein
VKALQGYWEEAMRERPGSRPAPRFRSSMPCFRSLPSLATSPKRAGNARCEGEVLYIRRHREKLCGMSVTDQFTGQTIGLTGVGYQGHDLTSFLAHLSSEGVALLVDVRLNAISRKRGFSKRALGEALKSAGIGYEHARPLGNPKENRAGFGGSPGEVRDARGRFSEELDAPAAQEWLSAIAGWASECRVALLCFEAEQERCHRDVVAEAVAAIAPARVVHRLG